MTLVVARALPGGGRMIGDSQISDLGAINRGTARGALKTVIVDRDLVIGFAGNLGRAQVALEAVSDAGGSKRGIDNVLAQLSAAATEGKGDTDFLVMSCRPAPEIVRVTDHGAERSLESSWIGDSVALEAYQKAYHSHNVADREDGNALDTASRMEGAFSELLREGEVTSVGAPSVSVLSTPDGLKYAPGAIVFPVQQTIPPDQWVTVRFGTSAEGGYGHSVLVPEEPGVGAIGVHFYPGDVGVLYHPLRFPDPRVYPDVTAREFIDLVKQDVGISIAGLIIG